MRAVRALVRSDARYQYLVSSSPERLSISLRRLSSIDRDAQTKISLRKKDVRVSNMPRIHLLLLTWAACSSTPTTALVPWGASWASAQTQPIGWLTTETTKTVTHERKAVSDLFEDAVAMGRFKTVEPTVRSIPRTPLARPLLHRPLPLSSS